MAASGEDFFHHLAEDIGEAEIAARVFVGELEVIDAEQVEHGGMEIVDVEPIFEISRDELGLGEHTIQLRAEQAGGRASDGTGQILDICPSELHQRVPLYIGSTAMVAEVEHCLTSG